MAEVKGRDNLSEELPGFFGSQPAFLYQVVKQLPTRHMLQYQIPEIQTGKSQQLSLSAMLGFYLSQFLLEMWRQSSLFYF